MLDWAPGGEKLWLIAREHGTSDANPVDENRLALLHSLGVHPSDILSAERVIIVEGPSDEDILGVWFPDLLRNPRIAVLQGEGGDNARHASRFAEWLAGTGWLGLGKSCTYVIVTSWRHLSSRSLPNRQQSISLPAAS
jgi:hypothetical protein